MYEDKFSTSGKNVIQSSNDHGKPSISVIITSTRERREHIERLSIIVRMILALNKQSADPRSFEVIIVIDNYEAEIKSALSEHQIPYNLILMYAPNACTSCARNQGSKAAKGDILLFIDDDVVPCPELIASHLSANIKWPENVILGYFSHKIPQKNKSLWYLTTEGPDWWDKHFLLLADNSYRFSFKDFCSGNVSMSRYLFEAAGGFNEDFRGYVCEDYDLGMRLLRNGANFRFVQEAAGMHIADFSTERLLNRAFREGSSHIKLVRKYPELITAFPISKPIYGLHSKILRFPMDLSQIMRIPLFFFEKLSLKALWKKNYDFLWTYRYWLGAKKELGSLREIQCLLTIGISVQQEAKIIEIDLAKGLRDFFQILNTESVEGIVFRHHDRIIGKISYHPGCESLRPQHIPNLLINGRQSEDKYETLIELFLSDELRQNYPDNSKKFFLFGANWYQLENWNGIPTHWISNDSIILVFSRDECIIELGFRALSFNRSRTLVLYYGDLSVGKKTIKTEFTQVYFLLPVKQGTHKLRIHLQEGCEKPADSKILSNPDERCLGIAIQCIKLVCV